MHSSALHPLDSAGTPAVSKRLKVVDALRQAITSGELKPGDRLIEREICEWTQASRPSVREAILQLKMEGFIRSTPNYGSVVATLTAEEAVNIYQMRGVLEGLAAKSFIELAHPEERRALRSALDNLHKQIEIGS